MKLRPDSLGHSLLITFNNETNKQIVLNDTFLGLYQSESRYGRIYIKYNGATKKIADSWSMFIDTAPISITVDL